MKNRIYALLLAFLPLLTFSQSVPFPSGNGRDYNAIEPYGYSDTGQGWNTSNYLPFIYHGIWFRMMLPNGVTYNSSTKTFSNANPGQTYPLILFFHGRGETGTDNNKQLVHGGELHKNAVLSGAFPGFLLYPQSVGADGGKDVLLKVIEQLPVDFNRIYVHGLSNGGQETWKFTIANPGLVAAAFPMSAADLNATTNENLLYTPLRESQGELDTNPSPAYGQQVKDWFDSNGGHLEYFFMTGVGHGTWNAQYNRADFFPWFLAQKKNKIMVRYDRNLICPGESASVIMGFSPGLQAYEWRKDGQLISGATTNKITATSFGSYTGRIRNRGVWSEWSEPVVVGSRPASVTPNIQVVGTSLYMPDINGSSAVKLALPAGYATYTWNKQGEAQPVGSSQQVTITSPGTYTGTITEIGGCVNVPSIPSPSVTVIDATGAAPNVPKNLQAGGVSLTSINLTWEDDPNPQLNEIGFEVYRSEQSGGPYALIATVPADVLTYLNTGLTQNLWYYYKVRAISATGASAGTAEVAGLSQVDTTPPTAPYNVTKTDVGTTAAPGIRLTIPANASTDNVGVTSYEVYQREFPSENWVKVLIIPFSTAQLQPTISNLTTGKYYSFIVKAKDAAGNVSGPSTEWGRNASYPATPTQGVVAKYYKTTSAAPWNSIPDFDALTPTTTSNMTNFTLTVPSGQPSDYFGFRYDAAIAIATGATYTFFTQSDEGSRLYINGQLVVDNDGLHTSTERNGTITLAPGYYPIRVEYFDKTGTQSLTVRWQAATAGIAKGTIPNASLIRDYNAVAGQIPLPATPSIPTMVSATAASYNSINVNFSYAGPTASIELQRSTNQSTWTVIATLPGSTTSYLSTGLNASTRYYYRARSTSIITSTSTNPSQYSSTVNAITQALPPLPSAPSGLIASNVTANSVTLDWADNANNESNYEIYKSSGDNTSYAKLGTYDPNTIHAVDATLFAHTTYYYKVLAKNVSGNSAYSNEIQITSANSSPTLNGVNDVVVRHSETYSIPLTAVDTDGDLVIIGSNNLPSFAQIFDYADGTGEIVLNPTEADVVQGLFPGIQVFAKDLFGGIITKTFSIRVNNNHPPVIADPGAITLKESFKLNVNVVATDADGDNLTWTMENVPAFITPTINGNTIALRIQPGLSDAGNYSLTFTATDPNGAVATRVVPITVTDYNPNFKVYVNVRQNDGDNSTIAQAPWNDYAHGVGTLALNNETGGPTGFTINVAGGGWQSGKAGKYPGIYPDPVNRSYMFFQASSATDSRTVTLAGLNPDGKYNVRILSSRTGDVTNNRTGIFIINGVSQSIQANENASTLVNFLGQTPNASGQIVITVRADMSGAGHYALVNAVVLESYFDDTSVPDAPTSLAVNIVNSQVRLSWADNSINEQGFEVHRSTDNVNFAKVTTTLPDVTTYTDPSVVSGQTYYYKVFAANNIGLSDPTNVVTVVGPNHAPVVVPVPQIIVGEYDMQWVEIDATDADGDPLTFDLVDAPIFTWLSQIDDNSTLLAIAPFPGDAGEYNFQISCTDINGATTLGALSIFVGQPGEISVKINFTAAGSNAAAPWNNVTGLNANTVVANLRDNNNAATSMSMTLQTGWQGTNSNGYTTGNNSGIYPDNVLRTSYYMENSTTRTVLMSGMNPAKAYDFTFFASRTGVADQRNTNYTIGLKTVVLDAANNQSNTVKITNVRPNASGQITVSMARSAGNGTFGYIGSMVVREYEPSTTPLPPAAPANLAVVVTSRSAVRLTWADASDDETGFEIYRSTGNNTAYTLIETVPANTTLRNNTGLSNGVTYYYKVRAINTVGASDYSNESSGTTFNYSMSINYNSSGSSASGWANLSAWNANDGWVPTNPTSQGGAGLNIIDDNGQATGVSMTVVKAFGGTNPAGMNVSNGVVPANVMRQSWFVDKGTTSTLRFGNLNLTKKYTFAFFGSRDDTNDPAPRTTIYTIGSTSVSLDCSKNTQNLAIIRDVVPQPDGTITVNVSAPLASAYGYLNGLIIQVLPNPNARIAADEDGGVTLIEANEEVQAYPNPFADRLTLKFAKGGHFQAKMLSINGLSAFQGEFDAEDGQEVELPVNAELAPGVYILNVIESKGAAQTIKLLKK